MHSHTEAIRQALNDGSLFGAIPAAETARILEVEEADIPQFVEDGILQGIKFRGRLFVTQASVRQLLDEVAEASARQLKNLFSHIDGHQLPDWDAPAQPASERPSLAQLEQWGLDAARVLNHAPLEAVSAAMEFVEALQPGKTDTRQLPGGGEAARADTAGH